MENIQNTLQVWGGKIVKALKAALPEKDANGALSQSINFSINYAGFPIVFKLQLADYYKYIDSGRMPGKFPPPDIIAAWIKNKQLSIVQNSGLKSLKNKARKLSVLSQQNQMKRLSFLIGRKIAKDGIAPTHFFSDTINANILNELTTNLSAAFKQDVLVLLNTD